MTVVAGQTRAVHDRTTGARLGAVTPAEPDQVAAVVAAAHGALRGWSADAAQRATVLHEWAHRLEADLDGLSDLIVGEVGKVSREARREVTLSADALRYNAGEARQLRGSAGALPDGSTAYVERLPVGVSAFIVPWNTPVLLLFRDLAPALAAGVTAVIKPSPDAPLSIERAVALGYEAGLPRDVVRIVQGGAAVGDRLLRDRRVRAVAFTGSTQVGSAVMAAAAADMTRVLLELGGKGVSVIHADADLDAAVRTSVAAACFTSGQMCMSVTRILAARPVYTEVRDAVVAQTEQVRVGDPRLPETGMGPLISAAHRGRVLKYVDRARRDGGMVVGGEPVGDGPAYMRPAVVTGLPLSSAVVQDEIFGPIVTVEPFDDASDAIAAANATRFGLAASVWTRDVEQAWRVGRGIEAGTVWINGFGGLYAEVPFGGMKLSGLGRTRARSGIDAFSELRAITFAAPGVPR